MNSEYKDFIGVFSNVYPEGFCEHLITEFDRYQALGAGSDRQASEGISKHLKNDYQISLNGNNLTLEAFNGSNSLNLFFEGLQTCFQMYSGEYSVIENTRLNAKDMKMQKTSTSGGYHPWHAEQGNGPQANRGLVYMLYLNTLPVEANGETEFLYQQRRINPVENTIVLWPAAFTHAHRGNPVYGDTSKYIVTGWFYHE